MNEVLQQKNEFCLYESADPVINRCIGESSSFFLKPYFLKFTRKARANVKYVAMDMNTTYFELVKAVFPNSKNCDRSLSHCATDHSYVKSVAN
ncbi:TPA: transposase [Enterococcus faecalis]